MKRQIISIIMKTTEGIIEATDPIGAIKAVVVNLIEAPNKGEGVSKTIIGTIPRQPWAIQHLLQRLLH